MSASKSSEFGIVVPTSVLEKHIWAVLLRFDIQDREDIAQEVLFLIWKHRDSLPREIHKLLAWVRTATRYRAYDFFQNLRRENLVIDRRYQVVTGVCEARSDGTSYLVDPVAPERNVEPDVKDILREALKTLKPEQRQVLLMQAEGYKYRDIARVQNAKIGTVRSRLHAARKNMQELVEL